MYIGRHMNICDYGGDDIYKFLKKYINLEFSIPKIKKSVKPTAIQTFIGDKNSYRNKKIENYVSAKSIVKINTLLSKSGVKLITHANYTTVITKPLDKNLSALNALFNELYSTALIGGSAVVVHTGYTSYRKVDLPNKQEINDAIQSILYVINRYLTIAFKKGIKNHPRLLIETSSGQGNEIAHKFADLGLIINGIIRDIKKTFELSKVKPALGMVGICVDTCHIFAAGYDIRTEEKARETFKELNKYISINKFLYAIHLNDSAFPLGSHRDVHSNIGCGFIGSRELEGTLSGYRYILQLAKKKGIIVVLETPSRVCNNIINDEGMLDKNENEIMLANLLAHNSGEIKNVALYSLIDYC